MATLVFPSQHNAVEDAECIHKSFEGINFSFQPFYNSWVQIISDVMSLSLYTRLDIYQPLKWKSLLPLKGISMNMLCQWICKLVYGCLVRVISEDNILKNYFISCSRIRRTFTYYTHNCNMILGFQGTIIY